MAIPPNARAGPSRTRGTRRGEDVDENGEEEARSKPIVEEAEDGWTVDTFRDQPIEKSQPTITFLSGLINKVKEVLRRAEEGNEKTKLGAAAIEDASPDDEMVTELEREFQQGLDKIHLLEIRIKVLEGLTMQLRQNEPLIDPMSTYSEQCKQAEEAYMAKTSRQKYRNHPAYMDFRTTIWEVNHQEEACPPMSHWLPHEERDGDEDEDEIEMGGQTQNYRCPLTLKPYENAMTCSACKHSYSKAAIIGILDQSKAINKRRQTKCPVAGCSQIVTPDLLKEDPGLQRRADLFQKRRQQQEAEQDDDDE